MCQQVTLYQFSQDLVNCLPFDGGQNSQLLRWNLVQAESNCFSVSALAGATSIHSRPQINLVLVYLGVKVETTSLEQDQNVTSKLSAYLFYVGFSLFGVAHRLYYSILCVEEG